MANNISDIDLNIDCLYKETNEKFNEIISEELQGFEVWEEKLSSGSVIKFKYKGQSK